MPAPCKASAIYTVNEDLTANMPWGAVPQKTQGTEILSVVVQAPSDTAEMETRFSGSATHALTDHAFILALFIDDEQYARRSCLVDTLGATKITQLALEHSWVPGDTLPHTYRIRIGRYSGVMRMNGSSAGPLAEGTMACRLTVKEF